MNILITGASGYIGKQLLLKFFSNKSLNISIILREHNSDLEKLSHKTFINDYKNISSLENIIESQDIILHLLGLNEDINKNDYSEYKKINIDLTYNLFKIAKLCAIKKFIFISTIKVYGEITNNNDFFSINSKFNPLTLYSKSKLAAEQALKLCLDDSDTNLIILRLPVVYGSELNKNFYFLSKIISKNIPIPFKNVQNKRSLLNINNLYDFLLYLFHNANCISDTFIIKDERDLSLKEIIVELSIRDSIKIKFFSFPIFLLKFLLLIIGKKNLSYKLFSSLIVDDEYTLKKTGWFPKYNFNDVNLQN